MDYVNKARRIMEEKTAASLHGAGQLSLQNQEIYSVIADARIREVRGSMEQARPEPKILHFSDGTLSVDELLDSEDDEAEKETAPPVDARTLDWLPWMWYQTLNAGATALKEFSRVRKLVQEDNTKYLHEAKIANRELRTIGVGLSPKSSKQDAAKKMVYIVLSNYHKELLEKLQPQKSFVAAETEEDAVCSKGSDGSLTPQE